MANTSVEEPCFLCDCAARWQESDAGARRHYLCTSPSCGEYEISLRAMERVKSNGEFKRRAAAMASRVAGPDLIVEIRIDDGPDKTVSAKVVKRRLR